MNPGYSPAALAQPDAAANYQQLPDQLVQDLSLIHI